MKNFNPDKLMLQNYIQNKLSDVDTEYVEMWLADNPEVMDDLEMDLIFKQALVEESPTKQVNISPFGFLDFFTSRKLVPVHLLAYGMVAFLMFTALSKNNQQSLAATFVELEKVRGLDTSIIEVQTNENQSLVLRFFPDSMTEKYFLTMKSKNSNQQIEFKDLIADDYGSITISVNNEEISVGKWEILLVDSINKKEQNYLLSINRK